jgi:hypothetical protein
MGVANVEVAEVGAETGSEDRYQTQRQCPCLSCKLFILR